MSVIATLFAASLASALQTAPVPIITSCSLVTPAGTQFGLQVRRGEVTTVHIGANGEGVPSSYADREVTSDYRFTQDGVKFKLEIEKAKDERGAVPIILSGTRGHRAEPMIVAFGFCGLKEVHSVGLKAVDLLDRTNWPGHCFTMVSGRMVKSKYKASMTGASYQEDELGEVALKRSQIQLPGPFEGSVSYHMSFVGTKAGRMDRETATVDSASGEAVIALRLTSSANRKFVPSRYMVCGSKSVKVGS